MAATLTCGATGSIATANLVSVILLQVSKVVLFVYANGSVTKLTATNDVNDAIAAIPTLNQAAVTNIQL